MFKGRLNVLSLAGRLLKAIGQTGCGGSLLTDYEPNRDSHRTMTTLLHCILSDVLSPSCGHPPGLRIYQSLDRLNRT
jgi:hypothetical protein